MQDSAPSELVVPVGHLEHDELLDGLNHPALHFWHDFDPLKKLIVPAGQGVQRVEPGESEKEPAGQRSQSLLLAAAPNHPA